jgi:putative heme-binding domain-containing protein
MLLDALESGLFPKDQLPAHVARQIAALEDGILRPHLARVWGTIALETPEEIEKQTAAFKALLTPSALASADPIQGRVLFEQSCGACHKLFDAGQQIGPDLTGSNRSNLDYLLENILNPSALIGKEYQLHTFTLKDGRVLAGMLKQETESAITLCLVGLESTIAKSDVVSREISSQSMMPAGLLSALSEEQIRNLILYLQSPKQVALPHEK